MLGKMVSIIALSAALLDGSMKAALPDKNIDGNVFLVNRQHAVSKYFAPAVRKVIGPGMSQSMRDDAAAALEEMFAAAKADGINLSIVSGYRSYSKQSSIYSRKKASQGQEAADRVSARPGTSEHQLGLAVDLDGTKLAYEWLAANCWEYGFILRYPADSVEITGVIHEPWHFRYVGTELSLEMKELGVCLEEYMQMITK